MKNISTTRINKYISEHGICSRREADKYIELGTVFLNGKRATIGDSVAPGDEVMINGIRIEPQKSEEMIFLAFNKPTGIVSTTHTSEKGNIISYIRHPKRIFPIGRLDKDSQGLIFLTNNGDIVNKILRAGNQHEKEYMVTVDKPITDKFINGMADGVPMLGTRTKKCRVSKVSDTIFKIILVQGLNRQIRRMCEYFGYGVIKLERTRIMNITLKGINLGEWRELTGKESAELMSMISESNSAPTKGSGRKKNSRQGKNAVKKNNPPAPKSKPKAKSNRRKR